MTDVVTYIAISHKECARLSGFMLAETGLDVPAIGTLDDHDVVASKPMRQMTHGLLDPVTVWIRNQQSMLGQSMNAGR